MILKGAEETSRAPCPAQALSMVLVRLAYVAGLPSPETWIAPPTHAPADLSPKLQASSAPKAPPPSPPPSRPAPQATGSQPSHPEGAPACASLQDVLDLLEARREGLLKAHLLQDAEVLSFQEGRMHLALAPESPTALPKQLQRFLVSVTKKPWTVSVSQERPQKTLADTQKENESTASKYKKINEKGKWK